MGSNGKTQDAEAAGLSAWRRTAWGATVPGCILPREPKAAPGFRGATGPHLRRHLAGRRPRCLGRADDHLAARPPARPAL